MSPRFIRPSLTLGAMMFLLGAPACGQLLDLDSYTKTNSGPGGAGGGGEAGQGGMAGQAGQGGQGGSMNECTPNEMMSCYDGPAGTENKGICKTGQKTCGADGTYGACLGQVTPTLENCATIDDEDCNGTAAACTGLSTWSKSYGTTANDQFGLVIRAMSDGSMVVAGSTSDTIDFGCGVLSSELGIPDIFLLKLDATGNCVFVKRFGTNGAYDYAYDVAIDTNDDILMTGGFTGTAIDFGGGALGGSGSNDIYLVRFDKNGSHIWSKKFGDNKDQLANSAIFDAQGNIIMAGDFGGVIDFGGGIGVTENTPSQMAGFVAKLDSQSAHIFSDAFRVPNLVGNFLTQTRATVDKQGNITVVGRFSGSLTVGNEAPLPSSGTGSDVFVLRYDSAGKLVFVKKFGSSGDDFGPQIATATDGTTYIAGRIGSATIDLSALGGSTINGMGGGDIYVVKLNADGTFAKAKVFGDSADQLVTSVTVDPLGHVLLGGYYKGVLNFGKTPLGIAMNNTLFLAKLDADLNELWARAMFSNQAQYSIHVGTDAAANILLSGGFYGSLPIEVGKPLVSAGNADIFVAKLAP
ncbi:MAG TPA: hypothetical protein PKA58_07085 [Polyangium sp.]|nr:hypothetical protein [Polyangium sp.]